MGIFDSSKRFIKAAKTGDFETVKRYLAAYKDDKSMNLNARDKEGMTALAHAALRGDTAMLKIMIEQGLDKDLPDNDGSTPLRTAAVYKQQGAALMLIEAGADIHAHTPNNTNPLHEAAYKGDLAVVKALLDKGADIDAVIISNGMTALHWAVSKGHAMMAETLAKAGARMDLPNHEGKTALNLAHAKGDHMVRLLEAANPQPPQAPSDKWIRASEDQVMRVGNYPEAGRKLTEIFNFSSRERIVITENLKTGAETMTPAESFDKLTEDAVRKALAAFKSLGGDADEETVLHGRGVKKLGRQP